MSNNIPARAGRGRSQDKSEEDLINEAKAKGRGQGHAAEREPGDVFERRDDRGHQRGFGKNQGKLSKDQSTAHGTKARGGFHS
jgi:hypothetical protein